MASLVTNRLTTVLRKGVEPLRALPMRARWWWAATLLAAVVLVPMCLSQIEPGPPLVVMLLAPLVNGLLVIVIAPRRQTTLAPTFDYGGIATVALLATFGPAAALSAFVGEKVAAAFLPAHSGQRQIWIRSVYNLAWRPTAPSSQCSSRWPGGCPTACSWGSWRRSHSVGQRSMGCGWACARKAG